MEQNISINKSAGNTGHTNISLANMAAEAARVAMSPIEWLRQYYSAVLGKEVSMGKTLRYIHAQVAFAMAVFPVYDSLLTHLATIAWFAAAVVACKDTKRK